MKRLFAIVTFVCSMTGILNAQVPAVLEQTTRGMLEKTPTVTAGVLSRYGGNLAAVSGVDFYLVQAAQQTNIGVITTPASSRIATPALERSWLTQQKRNIKAWQLKQQRQKQQLALQEIQLEELKLRLAKEKLPPLLHEKSFTVASLENLVPTSQQMPNPVVPFVTEPKKIAYRGLALSSDGSAIKNLLQNGLRLQDAGKENSTLRMAYSSHTGWKTMAQIAKNPVTNISNTPQDAANWGARRLNKDRPILTLIKIKGEFQGKSIEIVTTDIPADQIEEIAVRLNIDGNLTWCKVQLGEDGALLLTPYAPHYQTAK